MTDAILSIVACNRVDIAIVLLSDHAVAALDFPPDLSGFRIACDAHSAASSPATMKALRERGAVVFDVPGLHANFYRSNAQIVACSASNVTSGPNEEAGTENEVGIWSCNRADNARVRDWFDGIVGPLLNQDQRLICST